MKMMGIIFSNIYDEHLGEITKERTSASLPFGGRYRMIDFVLSNMVNSGITNVGVITKSNYQSLMDHLGNGKEWDLDRKIDGLFILPPFGTGQKTVYRDKLEALLGTTKYLMRSDEEYVLLSDSNIICNIDFKEIHRILKQNGYLFTVMPAKLHLFELKEHVYDTPYMNEEKIPTSELFELCETKNVHYEFTLPNNEAIQELFTMTPYYFKTSQKDKDKLNALSELTLHASFLINIYKAK